MAYSNQPESLENLLKEFMKRLPRKKELKRGMILHVWPEVVGEQVARATSDLRFERDKLIVIVVSDAWRSEIHLNRNEIKNKLNRKVGSEVVKEIVVRC